MGSLVSFLPVNYNLHALEHVTKGRTVNCNFDCKHCNLASYLYIRDVLILFNAKAKLNEARDNIQGQMKEYAICSNNLCEPGTKR